MKQPHGHGKTAPKAGLAATRAAAHWPLACRPDLR